MKKLIFLFIIIFCNCSQIKNDIENIQIISYYYKLNDSQTEMIMEYLNYSIVDPYGNTKSIRKIPSSGNKYTYFDSKINENIILEISNKNRNLKNEFYEKKVENFSGKLYCGPTIRVKIKYRNEKEITFNYGENQNEAKYHNFNMIQKIIATNYSERKYSTIENIEQLKEKQKEFEKYTIGKDTLKIPFPPMPKKVNFIK